MKVSLVAVLLVFVAIAKALPNRGPPFPPGGRPRGGPPRGPIGGSPGSRGRGRYPGPPVGPPSSGMLPPGHENDNIPPVGGAPPPGVAVQPMPNGRSPPGWRPRPMDQPDPTSPDSSEDSREIGPCTNGAYSRSKSNCSHYYQCSHGRRFKMICPAGLHFDTTSNVCNYPHMVGCVISAPTTTTTSTTTSSTTESSTRVAPLAPGEPDDADCQDEAIVTIVNGPTKPKLITVCTPGFGYIYIPLDNVRSRGKVVYPFGNQPFPSDMISGVIDEAVNAVNAADSEESNEEIH